MPGVSPQESSGGHCASLAFVVFAEMGDKTQLATVTLASRYGQIIQIWLGATSGMLVADALGIIVGIVMGKNIPERAVKWFAAMIFVVFGLIGLYDVAPPSLRTILMLITASALSVGLLILVFRFTGAPEAEDNLLQGE